MDTIPSWVRREDPVLGRNLVARKAEPKVRCAYSRHNSPARRVAVLKDGGRFPLCWSHRQGEIKDFDHWEDLA